MLMVLAISLNMDETERHIVTEEMIRGFNDCATDADCNITGGQSILNPWPIIGGVANVVCHKDEYIRPNKGQAGDLILLTKPLGTQVAVNLNEWLLQDSAKWTDKASSLVTAEEAKKYYYMAVESMGTLNRNAASLMHKYDCHGATDVTGFGIRGHAENLVQVQKNKVDFKINKLPIIGQLD